MYPFAFWPRELKRGQKQNTGGTQQSDRVLICAFSCNSKNWGNITTTQWKVLSFKVFTLALHHPLKPHAESRDALPRLVLDLRTGREEDKWVKNVTVPKMLQQIQQSGGHPDLWDIEEIPPEPPTQNTSFRKFPARRGAPPRAPQTGLQGGFPLLNPLTHKCPRERTAQEGRPAPPAQELQERRPGALGPSFLPSQRR